MQALGLRPKKHLGQHFLVDGAAAMRIAHVAIEGSSNDGPFPILEIGAGTGALTQALVDLGVDVTALEIDPNLVAYLQATPSLGRARIMHADALAFDYGSFAAGLPWRLTGNLPYNIATPLLLRLIELPRGPQAMIVMLQSDVAQRLAAKPATPAYGSLTLAVQYAMHVERLFCVGPQAFYPRPKVDSTVVRLSRHAQPPVSARDPRFLLQVTRAAFAYRRKTLANSLQLALNIERARTAAALKSIGLYPEIRGEELELAQFAALVDRLQR